MSVQISIKVKTGTAQVSAPIVGTNIYLRPGGGGTYLRPGGTDTYLRP
jgi:hypothetical protein